MKERGLFFVLVGGEVRGRSGGAGRSWGLGSVLWGDYAANEVASRRSAVGPTMRRTR